MSCTCDTQVHPDVLDIPPGLTTLPRAIGRFDDFRAAMWAGRADKVPLRDWSGQAPGDLGAMLVDWWAVVADIQAFYDQVRAEEAYIGTAPTQTLLRGLISRLGYRPKPATAASAWIALELTGVKKRTMPAGTGFRSGPVGDGPPQIFETLADATLYPALGSFELEPPALQSLAEAQGMDSGASSIDGLWVEPKSLRAKPGDVIVLDTGTDLKVTKLAATRTKTFGDEQRYTELVFDPAVALDPNTIDPDTLELRQPAQSARLWSASDVSGDPDKLTAGSLVLASQTAQAQSNDIITFVGSDGSLDVKRVNTARETQMTLIEASTTTATDEDGDEHDVDTPAVKVPTTQLTFSGSAAVGGDATDVVVGHGMVTAATVAHPPVDAFPITPGASLPFTRGWRFRRRWRERDPLPITALLTDVFGEGGPVEAEIDPNTAEMSLGGEVEEMDLAKPVTALGNAVEVSRGESIFGEVLGTGDGSIANQSFKLQKPLTYLPAPTESGYASTLELRVDGILVDKVPTLYGQPAEELVYMLREDEEDLTWVTFGNGESGARLATGAVITADYRTGGGADRPEADSISQLVSPVPAITKIHQPFEAFGGSDPEDEEALRENAPRSALLLGRAISLADFEAAAITQDGVDGAHATWAWSARRQRPTAQVWIAGDEASGPALSERLRAMTDPSTPIEVLAATPIPLELSLEVLFEPDYRSDDVLRALREVLTLPSTARLAHHKPRIGMALFRSPIVAEALAVPGVRSLDAVNADGVPLVAEGTACPAGSWFSIDPELGGALILNGAEEGP